MKWRNGCNTHFFNLLCFLSRIGFIFFLLWQRRSQKRFRWSALICPTVRVCLYLYYSPFIKMDFSVGKQLPNVSSATAVSQRCLILLTWFVLAGDHPGQQGLGTGPHGAVQRGDQVDEGRRHSASCGGSVRLWPVPGGGWLGPPQLQACWIQTQSALRDDACDPDVRWEQRWVVSFRKFLLKEKYNLSEQALILSVLRGRFSLPSLLLNIHIPRSSWMDVTFKCQAD